MVRVLKLEQVLVPALPQRMLVRLLLAVGGRLLRLAERLQQRPLEAPAEVLPREFLALEVAGQGGGALYEDGRLVAWLPEVGRL